MRQVTEVWIIDEAVSGDWSKIGIKADDHIYMGIISRTALAVIEKRVSSDLTFDELLLRAVRNFVSQNPNDDKVWIGQFLDLS